MHRSRVIRHAALAAGVLSLAAAAPAAADSISYVKGNDIYTTTPDGSRTFQVTSTGNIASASQADDGSYIARLANSEELQRLDRYGNVLAQFATPVSDGPTPTQTGSTNYFEGPFDPVISPDGSKVAYQYYWQHYTYDPTACGGSGCLANRLDSGTAITFPDRMTPWDVFGHMTGWGEPTWFGNDHVLRSNAGVALAENIVVNRVAPGLGSEDLVRWVKEAYTDERQHGTLSRDGRKLVAADEEWDQVPGSFRTTDGLRFYDASKGFGEAPVPCYRINYTENGEYTGRSSWSPDSSRLVFEGKGDQLWMIAVPDMAGCTGTTPADATEPVPFVQGGSHPTWSPADVPAGRPAQPQPKPQPKPGPGPKDGGTVTSALAAKASKAKLAKVLKAGLVVRYSAPAKGTATVTVRKGKRTVATGKAKAAGAGATSVKARFSKAGRKALRRAKTAKLTVLVAFKPASGAAATQTLRVTLKR
jgi:hypothetical protein